jgi:DNA-binding transcriptional MerR regulator
MAAGVITTTQLARLLPLSERRIQQLVRAGILKHATDDDGRKLHRAEDVEFVRTFCPAELHRLKFPEFS